MFNIKCYDVKKEDYGLGQYDSIKQVKFWSFENYEGKKINRFYDTKDHLELFVDKETYIADLVSGLKDIVKIGKLEKMENMPVRVHYI